MRAPLTVSRPELLSAGSDADFRKLVHGLLAFATRLESVRAGFARIIGLSPIQYTMVVSIAHLEGNGDVSVNMLAEHLQLSGAFITIETTKLVKLGLLTKQPDRQDRRRVSLKTTAKTRGLIKSLAAVQTPVNDLLFGFLDAAAFRELLGMIDPMIACADRALNLLHYRSTERLAAR